MVTGSGQLRARHIFHAVGPIYHGGDAGEPEQLASCYRKCLALAIERDLKSIAFPAISTGVYGYPIDEAANIAIREVRSFLEQPGSLELVRIVLFGKEAYVAFERALVAQTGSRGSRND